MDISQKLAILADAAKYDASCASSGANRKRPVKGLGNAQQLGVCHSFTPDGRCISLLKLLLTNHCIYECKYCINRASSPTRRAAFTIQEIVTLTVEFYKRNYIEGLFLSSGVMVSPDHTMERMKEVARRLRVDQHFGGYIHLKIVPGVSKEVIEQAGRWADRLSANIELPTQEELNVLAPGKTHRDVESSMNRIKQTIGDDPQQCKQPKQARRVAVTGQSTQMIIGATPASDLVILKKAESLYKDFQLRRVYYSAYNPIPFKSSEIIPGQGSLVREHRLYQADWLVRFYGFHVNELVVQKDHNLSLDQDPKMVWAASHPEFFPVDVNRAPKAVLVRVPGIGVRNALRILKIRKYHKLRFDDLRKLRIAVNRAKEFIITADYVPSGFRRANSGLHIAARPVQLELFDASALTGEL